MFQHLWTSDIIQAPRICFKIAGDCKVRQRVRQALSYHLLLKLWNKMLHSGWVASRAKQTPRCQDQFVGFMRLLMICSAVWQSVLLMAVELFRFKQFYTYGVPSVIVWWIVVPSCLSEFNFVLFRKDKRYWARLKAWSCVEKSSMNWCGEHWHRPSLNVSMFCMMYLRGVSRVEYLLSTVQLSTVQLSTVQLSTVQLSTVQLSTVHLSTVQFVTELAFSRLHDDPTPTSQLRWTQGSRYYINVEQEG